MWGNLTKRRLRDKIGVSAAVLWVRHGGVETTHLSHIMTFLALEMVPVSSHYSASLLGAGPVSSPGGSGVWDPDRVGIEQDEVGLSTIKPVYIQFVMGILGGIPATADNLLHLRNTARKLLVTLSGRFGQRVAINLACVPFPCSWGEMLG